MSSRISIIVSMERENVTQSIASIDCGNFSFNLFAHFCVANRLGNSNFLSFVMIRECRLQLNRKIPASSYSRCLRLVLALYLGRFISEKNSLENFITRLLVFYNELLAFLGNWLRLRNFLCRNINLCCNNKNFHEKIYSARIFTIFVFSGLLKNFKFSGFLL